MSNLEAFSLWTPDSSDALPENLGGKATMLARLRRAGFAVPDWVVIAPPAIDESPDLSRAEGCVAALRSHLGAMINPTGLWAVRSSMHGEDGAAASFAGQLESFLNVKMDDLGGSILKVWQSARSAHLKAYAARQGIELPPWPAVIVQAMIPAEWAGVAFSADPMTGRRDSAVVAVVRGLGERLVSGEASGVSYQIDALGTVTWAETEAADAEAVNIDASWIAAIAQEVRRAESVFGRPQDMEWALAENRLWIVQSRPITSLGQVADPDGLRTLWDDSNISESYCGVTTPLTYSFARYIYEEVYQEFCRLLGVREARIAANRDLFQRMLGLIEGRLYYNLIAWYRLIALLPGFSLNRAFMEQMMGVSESLSDDWLEAVQGREKNSRVRDFFDVLRMLRRLIVEHRRLPRRKRAFDARLEVALTPPPEGWEHLSADRLAASYRELERQLLKQWDAPLINDFFAMLWFGLLRGACRRWLGAEHELRANDLVAGEGGMVSTEPAERVETLARLAVADPVLLAKLERGEWTPDGVEAGQWPEFRAGVQAYLEKFGDRCMEELKLESRTLRDDPGPLLRGIAQTAILWRDGAQPSRAPFHARAEAEKLVRAKLKGHPLRRRLFASLLRRARAAVRDRENLRLQRTRLFGQVRLIFRAIGKRLWEVNRLDQPENVFYLSVDEVLGFIEGTAITRNLSALVALRREEFADFQKRSPAGRTETRGMVYVGNRFDRPTTEVEECGDLRGLPCCPGRIRGRVRVVRDPASASLGAGEILVAERTDPGWVLLFPAASGLLVEHGSLLSHAAIVAREMGLPAIVAVPGVTQRLPDGALIEMDGATGIIRVIEESEEEVSS